MSDKLDIVDYCPMYFDCTYQFSPESKLQTPLDLLCKSYLNLAWKKRKNQPFAFTETKISIALFERWKEVKLCFNNHLKIEKKSLALNSSQQTYFGTETDPFSNDSNYKKAKNEERLDSDLENDD